MIKELDRDLKSHLHLAEAKTKLQIKYLFVMNTFPSVLEIAIELYPPVQAGALSSSVSSFSVCLFRYMHAWKIIDSCARVLVS